MAGAACGSDDDSASSVTTAARAEPTSEATDLEPLSVVVTTSILGDVVTESLGELVGADITVDTIMPIGVSPHGFEPSTKQAETMEQADLLVVNGLNLEGGLTSLIEAAEDAGVEVFTFADWIDVLPSPGTDAHDHDEDEAHDHDHDEDEAHDHDEDEAHDHDEEEVHDHLHGDDDPHLWMDPTQVAAGVEALADELVELGADADAVQGAADAYIDELIALDQEITTILEVVPEADRYLVTNHQAFGYFADRYDFVMLGAAIPSLTTDAAASAAELEDLADLIREYDLPAIFSETTESDDLVNALADEVGNEVVIAQLYTGSLGEPGSGAETHIGMMTTNAQRVADALG